MNNEKNDVIDEIVDETIEQLEDVQTTFDTDSIEVLNEDAEIENVCEVEVDENENN